MGYPVLLLDADDTLFDFAQASAAAFSTLCRTCSLPWSEEHQALYDSISQSLWAQLDRGQVTKEFLVVERFRRYLSRLGLPGDPAECNRIYLETLGRSAVLLPHALEVCRTLAQDHRLYIITNAVASVQRARLSQSAITPTSRAPSSPRRPEPPSPPGPTLTTSSLICPASGRRSAWWWETL